MHMDKCVTLHRALWYYRFRFLIQGLKHKRSNIIARHLLSEDKKICVRNMQRIGYHRKFDVLFRRICATLMYIDRKKVKFGLGLYVCLFSLACLLALSLSLSPSLVLIRTLGLFFVVLALRSLCRRDIAINISRVVEPRSYARNQKNR